MEVMVEMVVTEAMVVMEAMEVTEEAMEVMEEAMEAMVVTEAMVVMTVVHPRNARTARQIAKNGLNLAVAKERWKIL